MLSQMVRGREQAGRDEEASRAKALKCYSLNFECGGMPPKRSRNNDVPGLIFLPEKLTSQGTDNMPFSEKYNVSTIIELYCIYVLEMFKKKPQRNLKADSLCPLIRLLGAKKPSES